MYKLNRQSCRRPQLRPSRCVLFIFVHVFLSEPQIANGMDSVHATPTNSKQASPLEICQANIGNIKVQKVGELIKNENLVNFEVSKDKNLALVSDIVSVQVIKISSGGVIWKSDSGPRMRTPSAYCFSNDSKIFFLATEIPLSKNFFLEARSAVDARLVWKVKVDSAPPTVIQICLGGRCLVTGGPGGLVKVFDSSDGRFIASAFPFRKNVLGLISLDNCHENFLAWTRDDPPKILNFGEGKPISVIGEVITPIKVRNVAVCEKNRVFAISDFDFWALYRFDNNFRSLKLVFLSERQSLGVRVLGFSKTGDFMYLASNLSLFEVMAKSEFVQRKVWEGSKGDGLFQFCRGDVSSVLFSRSGQLFALSGFDQAAKGPLGSR